MKMDKLRNTLKIGKVLTIWGWLSAALMLTGLAVASNAAAAGLLAPRDGRPPLTLSQQHVSVVIENGYAVTEIEQTFSNPHSRDLEAYYSFPVPENAAVGEFTFWIDGQPVHAEVLERVAARQLHDQQKQLGNDTAIVEQNGYQTFEMEVSPVRAGDDVRIRLVYLQRTSVDHSMGRYVYPLQEGGVDEARDSFWSRNEQVSEAFSFRLRLRSSYPVDAMRVTHGQARITQLDSGEWELIIDSKAGNGAGTGTGLDDQEVRERLSADDYLIDGRPQGISDLPGTPAGTAHIAGQRAYSLDRDIVVYWRLAENLPGSVDLVTFKEAGADTGTFMLTLTPGIDLAPITEGRDWIFVLDKSGSMKGKFPTLLDGVERALQSLNPADRFKVILFNDKARSLSSSYLPAGTAQVQDTLRQLGALQAGGGTNLFDGLQLAVKSLDADRTSAIVLVTDGVANIGETRMSGFLQLLDKVDVRLFTAVMGNSANRPLLEGLARFSEGFAVSVSTDDDIIGLMLQMTSRVTHEAMHNVAVAIDGVRTHSLTPDKLSRLYRGEQLQIMGKYSGSGMARVQLDVELSGQPKRYESSLMFPVESLDNPELERLWAFATIKDLQDQQSLVGETADSEQGITDIALTHGLVTDYTSLVVVRDEVFDDARIERRNARRIQRETLARESRTGQAIKPSRQDAQSPAFNQPRHTTSGGGGSAGVWLLAVFVGLVVIRIVLACHDRVVSRGADRLRHD